MVPSAFVILDAFPLTANGKVDRCALQLLVPTIDRAELSQVPQTTIEQTLMTLWQQLLGQEPIGLHDNFFELGGHSLLATQLISRVRDAFQIEVPLHSLFETPTIAGLATVIETIHWARQSAPIVEMTEATVSRREEVEL
jgi:acyl carrier protein